MTHTSASRLLDILLKTFQENGHFAMVEVQAGPGVVTKSMQSHKDGATGLLHLGLTLGGRRTLKVGTYKSPDKYLPLREDSVFDSNAWRNKTLDGQESSTDAELYDVRMKPGFVYLSSPFLFEH